MWWALFLRFRMACVLFLFSLENKCVEKSGCLLFTKESSNWTKDCLFAWWEGVNTRFKSSWIWYSISMYCVTRTQFRMQLLSTSHKLIQPIFTCINSCHLMIRLTTFYFLHFIFILCCRFLYMFQLSKANAK